jgi:hypothetical protein
VRVVIFRTALTSRTGTFVEADVRPSRRAPGCADVTVMLVVGHHRVAYNACVGASWSAAFAWASHQLELAEIALARTAPGRAAA